MYLLITDSLAEPQVAALPAEALAAYAELRTVLELTPWNGDPMNAANPDGAVRTMLFRGGLGLTTYLVLERQREVHVLMVQMLG